MDGSVADASSTSAAQEHFGGGYGGVLSEMRNPIDKRIERPAGGSWAMDLTQTPMPPPTSGYLTKAVVEFTVHSTFDDDRAAPPRL